MLDNREYRPAILHVSIDSARLPEANIQSVQDIKNAVISALENGSEVVFDELAGMLNSSFTKLDGDTTQQAAILEGLHRAATHFALIDGTSFELDCIIDITTMFTDTESGMSAYHANSREKWFLFLSGILDLEQYNIFEATISNDEEKLIVINSALTLLSQIVSQNSNESQFEFGELAFSISNILQSIAEKYSEIGYTEEFTEGTWETLETLAFLARDLADPSLSNVLLSFFITLSNHSETEQQFMSDGSSDDVRELGQLNLASALLRALVRCQSGVSCEDLWEFLLEDFDPEDQASCTAMIGIWKIDQSKGEKYIRSLLIKTADSITDTVSKREVRASIPNPFEPLWPIVELLGEYPECSQCIREHFLSLPPSSQSAINAALDFSDSLVKNTVKNIGKRHRFGESFDNILKKTFSLSE